MVPSDDRQSHRRGPPPHVRTAHARAHRRGSVAGGCPDPRRHHRCRSLGLGGPGHRRLVDAPDDRHSHTSAHTDCQGHEHARLGRGDAAAADRRVAGARLASPLVATGRLPRCGHHLGAVHRSAQGVGRPAAASEPDDRDDRRVVPVRSCDRRCRLGFRPRGCVVAGVVTPTDRDRLCCRVRRTDGHQPHVPCRTLVDRHDRRRVHRDRVGSHVARGVGDCPRAPGSPCGARRRSAGIAATCRGGSLKAGSRYRHPGDVIHLIASAALLVVVVVLALLAPEHLLGPDAAVVPGVRPATAVGHLLVGLVQIAMVAGVVAVVVAELRRHRYRLLGSVVLAAVIAGLVLRGLELLFDQVVPTEMSENTAEGGWLGSAAFPQPIYLAAAVAVTVIVTRWLTAAWQRTAWIALVVVAVARLITGTVLPMQLVLAFAVGATVGTGVLVAFGTPDRRLDEAGVVAALAAGDFPVVSATLAADLGKGSRPFVVVDGSGNRFFVKILGQDHRDADLLYRAYRGLRLRDVGDVRPAASLKQAVEHQALVGLMAERSGVHVPRVERVIEADDGSVLLVMRFVEGTTLSEVSEERLTDELLERLWREVATLHSARIAHRSLRTANVMVGDDDRPCVVDFSFSELSASSRAIDLDVAELLASSATKVGPDRAVAVAAGVLGPGQIAPAVPLLQPLALSSATRKGVRNGEKVLEGTRVAAAAVSGAPPNELSPIRRVKGKTLLMIALAAGAFYFILPQIAQVGESFKAFETIHWGWVPLIVVFSVLTYMAGAIGIMGTVPQHMPFVPTLNVQFASSFVNRVSPANVGGMAANVRFLQKNGVESAPAVAAIGLNSVVGGITHIVLLVVFFVWSRSAIGKAFSLPSGSKILLILAVVAGAFGILYLTRWGRKTIFQPLAKGLRSAGSNLARVAKSPVKLTMLFGGSAGVTLAYVGALAMAVNAFQGGLPLAKIGAVYLAASALAAATPTPGNLGAIEAARVADLTGVGMPSGPAVSAVLTYRLATYWLPILPGWLAWWYLQHKEYL